MNTLWSLSSDWVEDVLLAAGKRTGLVAVFRASKQLQQIVLSQPLFVPKLNLKLKKLKELRSVLCTRTLTMAEGATSNTNLKLQACNQTPETLRIAWQLAVASAATQPAAALSYGAAYQLHSITRITLSRPQGGKLCLDSLIPEFVIQSCPNLTHLHLKRVTITAASHQPTSYTSCLQHLTLKHVCFEGGSPSPATKHQLLHLTSLTALELHSNCPDHFQPRGLYKAACCAHSSRLKTLRAVIETKGTQHTLRLWNQPLPFSSKVQLPHLERLDLLPSWSVLSDDRMHQLLWAAPHLTSLKLHHFSLKTSFAQEPCSWQELTLSEVQVDQLALLPLSACTRIVCLSSLSLCSGVDQPVAAWQIHAGLAAVQAAGGLHFQDTTRLQLCCHDLPYLPSAAALFQCLTQHLRVTFCAHARDQGQTASWSSVYSGLLAGLREHLRCKQVWVDWPGWADHPGAFSQLPQLLPHIDAFLVYWPQPPAKQLVHACRTATRRFTLRVLRAAPGLAEQLEQAMQEAGHQLVTVSVACSHEHGMYRFAGAGQLAGSEPVAVAVADTDTDDVMPGGQRQ